MHCSWRINDTVALKKNCEDRCPPLLGHDANPSILLVIESKKPPAVQQLDLNSPPGS